MMWRRLVSLVIMIGLVGVPGYAASAPAVKPEDVADRVLNALAAADLGTSRAVLEKYVFPDLGDKLPSVVYSWRTMGQEAYTDGGIPVFRRFVDAVVESKAGTHLSTQLVVIMYIDRRVNMWRTLEIATKETYNDEKEQAAGTADNRYLSPSVKIVWRAAGNLRTGSPASALSFMKQVDPSSLPSTWQEWLATGLEAIYGIRQ
ncbi:MAG TPA: hypothetical protein VJT33_04020 [bacterium]|nr:hypothetical protein [bacterium]